MTDTPFFNRIAEKKFLTELLNQFVMVSGPTGYGKTRLLLEIKSEYETIPPFKENGLCTFVSIEQAYSGSRTPWIVGELVRQLAYAIRDADDYKVKVQMLAESIKEKDKALLVILDGLDRTSDEDFIWLRYELPFQLRAVLGKNVRVILSGRNIKQRNRALVHLARYVDSDKLRLDFYHCDLTPFDKSVVQQAIRWYMGDDLKHLDYAVVDRCTEEISFLSCGHPKAINILIRDSLSTNGHDWDELKSSPYLSEPSRSKLFQNYLSVVADEVLSSLLDDIRNGMLNGPAPVQLNHLIVQDIRTVALLRRIHRGSFVQLRKLDLLSTEPSILEGMLFARGLYSNTDGTSWQGSSDILKLLALQQRYDPQAHGEYLKKHQQLHIIFHQSVYGCEADGKHFAQIHSWLNETNLLFAAFESLYHFVCGTEKTQDTAQTESSKDQLINLAISYVVALEPHCSNFSAAMARFQDRLESPSQMDLHFLARWLFGSAIWFDISDKLLKINAEKEQKMSLDPQTQSLAVKVLFSALGYLTDYAGRWLNRSKTPIESSAPPITESDKSLPPVPKDQVKPTPTDLMWTEGEFQKILSVRSGWEIKRAVQEIQGLLEERLPELDKNIQYYQGKLDQEHPENELLYQDKLNGYIQRRNEAEARMAELINSLSEGHINLVSR